MTETYGSRTSTAKIEAPGAIKLAWRHAATPPPQGIFSI